MPNNDSTGPAKSPNAPSGNKNEGEGSSTAAREYNKHVEASVKAGHTEELAEEAKKALDGAEGGELQNAEAEAKRRGLSGAPSGNG